jgi:hypothetical protein
MQISSFTTERCAEPAEAAVSPLRNTEFIRSAFQYVRSSSLVVFLILETANLFFYANDLW